MKFVKTFESFGKATLRYVGPNPTADTIVTRTVDGTQQVLLIQRGESVKAEPNKWSIPGGFVDTTANRGNEWEPGLETELQAGKREILEETGLDLSEIEDSKFKLLGVFDDKNRDPRNSDTSWVEAHSFTVEIPGDMGNNVIGMDDAQSARWFSMKELNQMNKNGFAFDHGDRLRDLGFISE
jgi:ADP-ribose pyrophosphatase YjhB (NUDIX family)